MKPATGTSTALSDLTIEQFKQVKAVDDVVKLMSNLQNAFKDYKLGDVYIVEQWDHWNPKSTNIKKNHMGFPVKYKVVHISSHGIPFFRQLSPNGKPTGDLQFVPHKVMFALNAAMLHANTAANNITQRFIPDPEALDAILLQEEFQPMAGHKEKLALFNEINKHNKKALVRTDYYNYNTMSNFFKSLKAGDKFWTSPSKAFVFQALNKVGKEYQITAVDQNHATKVFKFSDFTGRRLYRDAPRSFALEAKA